MGRATAKAPTTPGCPGCHPPAELARLVDLRPSWDRPAPRRRPPARTDGPADTIVRGAIVTMDPSRPEAEALAIRDGRIVAVGSADDVALLDGPDTETVVLGDAVCYPGFVEPHMHIWASALLDGFVDCSPLVHERHETVFEALTRAADDTPAGAWVRGQRWDPSLFPDAPPLDRELLDALVPDHPVLVMNASLHFAYLNSRALEAVGYHDGAPDPPGGFLGRRDGRLDGVLGEMPAISPALGALPRRSHDQLLDAVVAVASVAAAAGVTKVHEAGSGAVLGAAEVDVLTGLAAAGRLPVRVTMALFDSARAAVDGCRPGDGDDDVRVTSWKLIADGSNQGRSGHLRQPYLGSDERGVANHSTEDLRERMARAEGEGWQLMVHANGDAALDQVLDAYEAIGPRGDRRHRIEHSSLADAGHFARMAALGVSPSFLMNHVHWWGDAFRHDILGPARADTLDSAAGALRAGLRISFHSDYAVSPVAPLLAVQTAVTRLTRGGHVLNAAEAITVEEALRAVTIDAAWQTHSDHQVGSLEVGKYADLVFLDADPRRVAPHAIGAVEVLETRLAGRTTYSSRP